MLLPIFLFKIRWKIDEKMNLITNKHGQKILQFHTVEKPIMLGKFHEKSFLVQVIKLIILMFIIKIL